MRIFFGLILFFCGGSARAQVCVTTYGYLYVDVRCSQIINTGYTYNGNTFHEGGSYTVYLVNSGGCDSVVTLDINIAYPGTSTTDTTVLACQLPFHWGCQDIYEAGTYGCPIVLDVPECGDSAAYLVVTVALPDTTRFDTTICFSETPYYWNGQQYYESGVFTNILNPNTNSCSVELLQLTVLPNPQGFINATVCSEDLPFLWNGQELFLGGTYSAYISTASRCDSLAVLDLYVPPKPMANFGYGPDTLNGKIVHFLDSSQNGFSETGWGWDFGDGFYTTEKDPVHSFAGYSEYQVKHWCRSAEGCYSDTVTRSVSTYPYVNNQCGAAFFVLNNSCNNPTSFTNVSTTTDDTGPIVFGIWDYGDGKKDTIYSNFENTNHTYESPGIFTASLTIFTTNCTSASTQEVIITSPPHAKFGFADTSGHCMHSNIAFTDSSSVTDGSITGYAWYFGDGAYSDLQNPTHQYAVPGTYAVSQFVYSAAGCSDSSSQTYTISPDPGANFSFAADSAGSKTIRFVNLSTIPPGMTGSYLWNFGDDSTSTQLNPGHSYLNYGTYTVGLKATSDQGCSNTIVKTVGVGPASSHTTYTFNGSGNWSDPANWLDHIKPPGVLPAGSGIIITGNCMLNVPQTIGHGASLEVATGGHLTVMGDMLIY